MDALELARAGQLTEALASLQQQVRQQPAQPKLRVFLFQLLAVLGQYERALTQLTVAGELDAGALAMVQAYRDAIQCEVLRQDVFAGRRTALVLGEPPAWLASMFDALRLDADGAFPAAQRLRAGALEAAAAAPGAIDGQRFEWLADADPRLGPVLEVLLNGRYYWVPFERIAQIDIEPPADLRDLVWLPAAFTWRNGGQAMGLVPARYPGTVATGDPALLMCRRTDWQGDERSGFSGLGQRMLATDAGDYPLLAVRSIRFDDAVAAAPAAPAGTADG